MVDQNKVNLQLEDAAEVDFGDFENDLVDDPEQFARPAAHQEKPELSHDDFNKSLDEFVKEDQRSRGHHHGRKQQGS